MYRFFRKYPEAVKKWLLILFLGVVSVSLVLSLAPLPSGETGQMESNVLAEIGGTPITTLDVQRSVQSRLRNSPLASDPQFMARMVSIVLEDMILRRALWSEAKRLGLDVSEQELGQTLRTTMPFLYLNGDFVGMDRYRDLISQQTGMTVPQFEAQLRESLLVEKIRAVVTDGVTVSPPEVREEYLRRNAKARVEYVLFEPGQFVKAVEVSPPVLEAFLQKAADRYKIPEERRVRYVLIDMDRIRGEVKLGEEELKQYYSRHLSEYHVEDRVHVAHILFKTEGKTADEIATLEKTAGEVLAQAKGGANFGELARKYSEDSSAASGGEIGWIARGQTVREFEQAAFSMKPGELSDLIKTTYGFHIVKVFDKQSAHLQTFAEVKDQIREQLLKQKLAEAQEGLAREVERQFRQSPQDFDGVARKFGLQPKESPLFRYNRAVPDFGTSDSFHNLAFQLREGEVGIPITVPKGTAIIQVMQIVPEHAAQLDEVRARVEQEYRTERSQELAAQRAREFAEKAKTGDFRAVARAAGLTVKRSNGFTQRDSIEGVGSGAQLESAFSLTPGQTSDAVAVGANYIVYRVLSQTPADESGLAAQQDEIAEELLARKRNLIWELYRQSLKQKLQSSGELKLNESAMKQFLASYERERS